MVVGEYIVLILGEFGWGRKWFIGNGSLGFRCFLNCGEDVIVEEE